MRHKLNKYSFTLMELMLAATILVVALVGLLATYVGCFTINETAKNLTLAINAAQQKLEEIRDYNFYKIYEDYNNTTFEVSEIPDSDAEGSVNIDDTDPDLIKITVSVCWQQRGGRIHGEDNGRGGGVALNGKIDGTEDGDGDGIIDSPAQIVTLITNR